MVLRRRLLIVSVLLASFPAFLGASAVEFSWLDDLSGRYDIVELLGQGEDRWTTDRRDFGARPPAVHWARCQLEAGGYVLDFLGGWRSAAVWIVGDDGLARPAGSIDESMTAHERPLGAALALPIELSRSATVVLRLETGWLGPSSPEWLTVDVVPEAQERERARFRYALNGVYTGIVIAVVAYTFFLFLATGTRVYLLYVLYAGSFGLTWISQSGFGFEFFWPSFPNLQEPSQFVPPAMAAFFGAWFAREFLDARRLAPLWNRALAVAQGAVAVAVAMHFMGLRSPSEALLGALALIIVVLAVPPMVAGLRAKSAPARIFVFANGPLLFFVVLYVLGYFGWIAPSFLVIHGAQISSAVEKVLLAFGVAQRINFLKEEKRRADRQRRQSLEHEVAERTQALEEARAELQQSNTALVEANHRLEELSTVDSLTGVANRRQFDAALQLEWARCKRHDAPLTVLLVDIDHFKQFNDSQGHLEGDECLARVARALNEQCRRAGDLVARYGGEEFAVILPVTPKQEAHELALRVRRAVEDLEVSHESSGVSDFVTISVGAATLIPSEERVPLDLVGTADRALYEAKRAGRNRVVAA
ncbi:MAG: diguanylate cyclase [Acidobacteriota bacterium]